MAAEGKTRRFALIPIAVDLPKEFGDRRGEVRAQGTPPRSAALPPVAHIQLAHVGEFC